MTVEHHPVFSIILPTRGRPEALRNVLESFALKTSDLHALEVVLVIDRDDEATLNLVYDKIQLKRVIVEPGLRMGELNMAGYEASSGDYLMLFNDDVTVRTQGWDEKVLVAFRSFPDGIVLVHTNDGIYGEKLCTFPFLSRTYCELAQGICPRDYIRFRIDDHIYSVFNLLAFLGQRRILYMPEVMFEHANYALNEHGEAEYTPDPEIHAIDTERFDALLADRKRLTLKLLEHINGHFSRDTRKMRESKLEQITDSVSLRRREYIRFSGETRPLNSANTRVTIGIVSADIKSAHARKCIDLVKRHTSNCDLLILDNSRDRNFNHPREMNRIISMAGTEYLVLMDDDVHVGPGWLDAMLRCITPRVGVVTPVHLDRKGNLSYAGIIMRPDGSGEHSHMLAAPQEAEPIQTFCSAILLIDLAKCGDLRFDEQYDKYFFDVEYGLRVWEAGFQCICSPYTPVIHLAGATLPQWSGSSEQTFEQNRSKYCDRWTDTGRYEQLQNEVWKKVSQIRRLLDLADEVETLLQSEEREALESLRDRCEDYVRRLSPYPVLVDHVWMRLSVSEAASWRRPGPIGDAASAVLAELLRPLVRKPMPKDIWPSLPPIDFKRRVAAILHKVLTEREFERFLAVYRDFEKGWTSPLKVGLAGAAAVWGAAKSKLGPGSRSDSESAQTLSDSNVDALIAADPRRFELTRPAATYKLEKARLFNDSPQPWRCNVNRMDNVNPILSMIGEDEAKFLYWLTKDCYSGAGAIVDLGPLAGGSTHALASGLSQNPAVLNKKEKIHSYDLWEFDENWGWMFPALSLRQGQDLLPVFENNLSELLQYVAPHKGDLSSYTWTGGPIEILFIDAAKTPKTMAFIVNNHFPFLVPGRSIVVHQDFICSECPWIHITCRLLKDYFDYVDSPDGGSICFVAKRRIRRGVLPDNYYGKLTVREARHLLGEARKHVRGWYKLCVWLAEAHYLALTRLFDEAAEVVRKVQAHPDFNENVYNDVNLVVSKLPQSCRKGISIVEVDRRFSPHAK